MRTIRFLILTLLLTLSVVTQAQGTVEENEPRDFLFVAIDPRTAETAQNSDIYLIHSDGRGVVNLTDTEFDSENHAVWSADGKRIYFSRNSMGRYTGFTGEHSSTSFYIMDVSPEGENSGERLLFELSEVFGRPVRVENWTLSPDEQTIVFGPYLDSPAEEESLSLYLASLDGISIRRLVLNGSVTLYDERGLWSPDSQEIAFLGQVCTDAGLCHGEYFVVQPESLSQPEQIGFERDLLARWQPGEIVAFADPPDVVVEIDGEEEPIFVSNETTVTFMPALSPDESTLVYSLFDGDEGTSTLMSVALDGDQEPKPLTPALQGGIQFPRWSPDGEQILFAVRPTGAFDVDVYVVNVADSILTELYSASVWNLDEFAWRPMAE